MQFPKATDIEWDRDGDLYLVDFEMNWDAGHEIWYDATGKMAKHTEEIEQKTLPATVISKINTEFKGYNSNDIVVKEYNLGIPIKDNEGLAYDLQNNRLLIAGKRRAYIVVLPIWSIGSN